MGGPLPLARKMAEQAPGPAIDINAAAVTAYRDSLRVGAPLSERKLAEMFGQTSRRWARNRIAEARRPPRGELAGTTCARR
jgi:hypothetical protein